MSLINWYEPLYDGHGNKSMYDMADELMQLAIRYSSDCLPEEWRSNPDSVDSKKGSPRDSHIQCLL
jgi:hypothetical protein